MPDLKEYSRTEGGNGLGTAPDWPEENWTSDEVNDFLRKLMAQLALFYDDASFVEPFEKTDETWTFTKNTDTELQISGPRDASSQLAIDRRIRLNGSGGVVGWISGISYAAPDHTVTVELDSGIVPTTVTTVELSLMQLSRAAHTDFGTAGVAVVKAEDFPTTLGQALPLGTAATVDHGPALGEVPLNSNLGSASLKDTSVAIGDVPINVEAKVLDALAYRAVPNRLYATKDDDEVRSAGEDITDLTALAIPGANGVKKYRVHVTWQHITEAGVEILGIHVGTNGTSADAETYRIEVPEDLNMMTLAGLEITPDTGHKIGLVAVTAQTVRGVTTSPQNYTFLEVVEVLV